MDRQERNAPRARVLDCSIRDGGLMNRWYFDPKFVRASMDASVQAGVEWIEPGYKAGTAFFNPAEYGIWRFSTEETLRAYWGQEKVRNRSRLAIMLDVGRLDLADLLPARDSVVSLIRVACYVHQIPDAVAIARELDRLGYLSTVNVMAVSNADPRELEQGLELIARDCPSLGIYVVDSNGNLNPESTRGLVAWYRALCPRMEVGFHGHNNQQLALANTLAAMEAGATMVDASIYGMGRGAGNCNLELLLSQMGRSPAEMKPLFQVMEDHVVDLQREMKWGYSLPYALGGMANQHPRRAMALMDEGRGVVDSGYLDELAGTPAEA